MVQLEKQEGLHELRFHRGSPNGEDGFIGEDGSALGYGPDIPGEAEVLQPPEELLIKDPLAPKILDVLPVEVQILHIVDDLLQTGGDGKASPIGHLAEKYVEIADLLMHPAGEVAVAHGQLIEIAKHGVV